MDREKLIIVDGNSLANRAFYALPGLSNSEGVLTNAVYGFNMLLLKIIKNENPDYIAVCFDKKGPLKRKEDYAEYKANRKPMPEELSDQMPLIKEYLKAMNIYQCEMDGVEADDLIGTISQKADKKNVESIIYSADKDLLQLITKNTKVSLTKKGIAEIETYGLEELMEKYGLSPEQMIDLKGLMGDSSDNVPGVPGVGEKTALKLIHEFGSMENLYDNLDKVSAKKLNEKLSENKDLAFLSKKIVRIDQDLDYSFSFEDLTFKEPSLEEIIEFYKKLEINPDQFLTLFNMQTRIFEDNDFNDEPIYELKKPEEVKKILGISPFKEMVLYLECQGKKDIALNFMVENCCYRISVIDDVALVDEVKKYLQDDSIKKTVYSAKALHRFARKYNFSINGIQWDVKLQAYLLNTEEPNLEIEHLAEKYLNKIIIKESLTEKLFSLKELGFTLSHKLEEDQLLLLYSGVELPLTRILANMEYEGISVDLQALQNIQKDLTKNINRLTNEIYVIAKEEFNINSPKQLAVILFEKLGLPAAKKTKTGYSTNAEVLEELRDQHEIIEKILEYRMLSKLKGTYIDGFEQMIDPITKKIHTFYHQTVTATGRLSSSEPNLQNIPIRTEQGRRIREIFTAGNDSHVLIAADYSQIELRILAHVSQDASLMAAFTNNEDIHTKTAAEVFGVGLENVTSEQRRAAKAINFGIMYGQTDYGLSQELHISRKEAQEYINRYFEQYEGVKNWIETQIKEARINGYVTTLLGRRRYLKDINSKNYNLRSFAERAAVNSTIQGTAADIIKLAMLKIQALLAEKKYQSQMIMQVHDELIFEVPPRESSKLIADIHETMENAYPLIVPLSVDAKAGFNLFDMEKI